MRIPFLLGSMGFSHTMDLAHTPVISKVGNAIMERVTQIGQESPLTARPSETMTPLTELTISLRQMTEIRSRPSTIA